MVRSRAAIVSAVSGLLVFLGLMYPPNAQAIVPSLATVPCTGSSLCSPAAPGILAELAAQGGSTTAAASATAGTALTAAEAASFSSIVAGYGATATTSGSAIVGATSAAGAAGGSLPFVGAAVGLLTGGVAAWQIGLNGTTTGLPAGATGAVGVADLSYVSGSYSYTFTADFNAARTAPNYFVVISGTATPSGGNEGVTQYLEAKCNGAWMGAAFSSWSSWQFNFANPYTKSSGIDAACRTGSIDAVRVLTGSNFSTATVKKTVNLNWSAGAPTRYIEQTVTCKNRAGSTLTVTNSTSPAVWTGSTTLTLAGLMCPAGYKAVGWKGVLKTAGGVDTDLGSITETGYPSNPSDSTCGYVGDALCILRLERRTSTASDTWVSCHSGTVACTKWAEDPARQQLYRCRYGPSAGPFVTVNLGACTIYVDSFPADPTTTPPVITQPRPLPPPSDGGDGDCDLGWADVLNGTVVFKAVGCAMVWAFVPSEATYQTAITDVQTAFAGTITGQVATAVGNVAGPLTSTPAGSGSCEGPAVPLDWINDEFTTPLHPIDTCDGLPKKIRDWAAPFVLITIWGAALMSSWFMVSGSFGLQN